MNRKNCKYYNACGSSDNCYGCNGYLKSSKIILDAYGLIPLGTKTKYGIIQGIHSKNGERSYFISGKIVSLMPHDILIRDMEGK